MNVRTGDVILVTCLGNNLPERKSKLDEVALALLLFIMLLRVCLAQVSDSHLSCLFVEVRLI